MYINCCQRVMTQWPPPPTSKQLSLSFTHTFTFQLPHCPSFIYHCSRETKKDLQMMNSPVTCLHCPPSVWLSASFTPAIFSHFANLPARWEDAGKLLKVLWLQMSGPDVPLFLQWSCDFICIYFQLFAPLLTPCPTHTDSHTYCTHTTVEYWTHANCAQMHTHECKWFTDQNILWDLPHV